MIDMSYHKTLAALIIAAALATVAGAQPRAGRGQRGPTVVSPEVMPDGRVVFRVAAPDAKEVTFTGTDATNLFSPNGPGPLEGTTKPAVPPGATLPEGGPQFEKNDAGIWEATLGPLPPGAYRYVFMVDGVRVIDPVNPHVSESRSEVWSLFTVPGSELIDTRDVPHGAVAEVFYYSEVLQTTRRMHIYTPPGYENNKRKYPVFYLLHGSTDSDDSWSTVGRATFILDNLIAARKAQPMIMVMPNGHQPPVDAAAAPTPGDMNPFTAEFLTDILPYVEKHYRSLNDRPHRAIAGLSMGGNQTMTIAFTELGKFAYIGVFSSGVFGPGSRRRGSAGFGAQAQPPAPDWEASHLADLDNPKLKKGTKLIWFRTGVDDGLISTTKYSVELLQKHGFEPFYQESAGAHTWFNWRNYLIQFAPQLF